MFKALKLQSLKPLMHAMTATKYAKVTFHFYLSILTRCSIVVII